MLDNLPVAFLSPGVAERGILRLVDAECRKCISQSSWAWFNNLQCVEVSEQAFVAVDGMAKWCCSSGGTVPQVVGPGESAAVAGVVLGISLSDLCSLLIRQTSQNAWWILTPAFAPTGLWLLFAALVTSSRLSSLSCCLRDESESPSAAALPHLLPAPEAVVMAISEEEEEKNQDKWKACSPLPSAGSRWSTTVSFLQPQEPLSPLILSRVLFSWVTCVCGLDIASPWACWLQLCAVWTVRHLFLMAVLHAYASSRQRWGGRGYYLK